MENIKVSIIMPMLNSIRYLKECMDSIVSQTLEDIEIIPVDAGSTDGTLELLEEYARRDKRIKILHSEKKSMGHQYNLGIKASQGEYVGFLESDDYAMPEMYETLYHYIKQNDVDWVKGNYYFFMDYPRAGRQLMPVYEKRECRSYEIIHPQNYPMQYIQEVYMWPGIYKRQFLLDHNILLNETPGAAFQDTGFVLQTYMYASRAMYIEECLYCYRRDNQGSSAHQSRSIAFEIEEVEYMSEIIRQSSELYHLFWGAHYIRAWNYFFAFYKKLPSLQKCSEEILEAIRRYKDFLIGNQDGEKELFKNESYYVLNSAGYYMLQEGQKKFDAFYRRYIRKRDEITDNFVRFVLQKEKIIIWGCGDNGLGLLSLLLRLNASQEIYLCDNQEKFWNQTIMGIKVLRPSDIPKDCESIILIANREHFSDINVQLLNSGYDGKQIWAAPEIFRVRGTNMKNSRDVLPCE